MRFLSHFHDPDDLFVPILERCVGKIPEEIVGSTIAVTPETTIKVYELLKKLNFKIIEGGPYGVGRMAALKSSLKDANETLFFVCDFDKMLHWIENDIDEFKSIFKLLPENDLTAIARGEKAILTYPTSWVETEFIVTRVVGKILGKEIDLMNGPYIVNRRAGETIAEFAKETGVGACAEWCLISHLHNLSVGNHFVNGLTWEDPDRYQKQIQETGNLDVWKEKTFDSLYEWRKRIEFLHRQVEVMIRLTNEPINPKFPASSHSATDALKRF